MLSIANRKFTTRSLISNKPALSIWANPLLVTPWIAVSTSLLFKDMNFWTRLKMIRTGQEYNMAWMPCETILWMQSNPLPPESLAPQFNLIHHLFSKKMFNRIFRTLFHIFATRKRVLFFAHVPQNCYQRNSGWNPSHCTNNGCHYKNQSHCPSSFFILCFN